MSDVATIAGTRLFIAAAAPAAQTVVAFEALTWVEVKPLENVGSVEGREYSTSSFTDVSEAQEVESKGTYKLPSAEFSLAWVPADPGQILCKAASKDYSIPSFKVTGQDSAADVSYFTGQVSKFIRNGGGANDTDKGSLTILRRTDTITA